MNNNGPSPTGTGSGSILQRLNARPAASAAAPLDFLSPSGQSSSSSSGLGSFRGGALGSFRASSLARTGANSLGENPSTIGNSSVAQLASSPSSLNSSRSNVNSFLAADLISLQGKNSPGPTTAGTSLASRINNNNNPQNNQQNILTRNLTQTRNPAGPAPPAASPPSQAPSLSLELLGPFSRDHFLPAVLTCGNCESHDERLGVWCQECQAEHNAKSAQNAPALAIAGLSSASAPVLPLFVLCESCNLGLHKPARMVSHKRIPFRYYCSPPRSASDCRIREKIFPPALSAHVGLHQLLCANCEANPVTYYCGDCQILLCRACTRDLHSGPKGKKFHVRFSTPFKFVTPPANNGTIINTPINGNGNAQSASSLSSISGFGRMGTLSGPAQPAPSVKFTVSPVVVPNPPSLMQRLNSIRSGAPSPTAATEKKITPSPSPPTEKIAANPVVPQPAAIAPPAAPAAFPAPPPVKSVVSCSTSSSIPGDLLHVHEISLTGDLPYDLLQCRNTFNPFDFIGNVQIVQISAGQSHCGAVTAGGSLFMWGSNQDGQLGFDCGEGKECSQPTIVQLEGNRKAAMVACGYDHTICSTKDQQVFTWGAGLLGRLGHGGDANYEIPMRIDWANHTKASAPLDSKEEILFVAAGQHNSGVIVKNRKDRRQLYLWGANNSGLLGTGDLTPRFIPHSVRLDSGRGPEGSAERFPDLVSLAFGGLHTVVVTSSGEVYTAGSNSYGQLGYSLDSNAPDGENQLTFKAVARLKQLGVRALSASTGELMSSILTATGEVYSWGSGETHQLGIMDNVDQFTPVKAAVLGGSNPELRAVSLAVGTSACAAVTETGDVYAWGYSVETPVPALVSGLRSNCIQRVALGALNNLVCLTGVSNEVFEWRFTEEGEEAAKDEPVLNRQLRGKRLKSMAVGKFHYSLVTAGGKLIVWGSNVDNQLGVEVENSSEEEFARPIELQLPHIITEVRCAAEHSVALTDQGRVLCWGLGGMGRLGHGNDGDQRSPKLVSGLEKIRCVTIAIGPHNTGAVAESGIAYVWGSGHAGQLGNNSLLPVLSPITLEIPGEKIRSFEFGNRHTAVLTAAGRVFTFGENQFGQLGISGLSQKFPTPQRVESLARSFITAIACGDNITFCLTSGGELFAFGQGETQQLCTADGEDSYLPVKIPFPMEGEAPQKIVSLSVSTINCAAVAENGAVFVWGFQLGEKPKRIESLFKAKKRIEKVAMGPSSLMLTT